MRASRNTAWSLAFSQAVRSWAGGRVAEDFATRTRSALSRFWHGGVGSLRTQSARPIRRGDVVAVARLFMLVVRRQRGVQGAGDCLHAHVVVGRRRSVPPPRRHGGRPPASSPSVAGRGAEEEAHLAVGGAERRWSAIAWGCRSASVSRSWVYPHFLAGCEYSGSGGLSICVAARHSETPVLRQARRS